MRAMLLSLSLLSAACATDAATADRARARNLASPWYAHDAERGWMFDALLGIELEPEYSGSDESELEPDGGFQALWSDGDGSRYRLSLGEVAGTWDLNDSVTWSVGLEYEEGRDGEDSDLIAQLEPVDDAIELKVGLFRRWDAFTFAALAAPDLLGGQGNIGVVRAGYDTLLSDDLRLGAAVDLTWGDAKHHDAEFGVSPMESIDSGLRAYDAHGGLKSATASVVLEHFFNDAWSVYVAAELEYYFDQVADSPLIEDEGSRTTLESLLGVRWSF